MFNFKDCKEGLKLTYNKITNSTIDIDIKYVPNYFSHIDVHINIGDTEIILNSRWLRKFHFYYLEYKDGII